jgi:hypothetical protein
MEKGSDTGNARSFYDNPRSSFYEIPTNVVTYGERDAGNKGA